MRIANARNSKILGAIFISFALFALGIFGCSSTPPMGPEDNSPEFLNSLACDPHVSGWDDVTGGESDGMNRPIYNMVAVEVNPVTIGVTGGAVAIDLGGTESQLYVLAAALTEEVAISVEAVAMLTRTGPVWLYDFGPDGLVFRQPAVLRLQTDLPANTLLKFYYLDPSSGKWELEQAAVTDGDGVVVFNVKHFSKYAIS